VLRSEGAPPRVVLRRRVPRPEGAPRQPGLPGLDIGRAYRCWTGRPGGLRRRVPAGLGVAREREMLEAAGHAVGVRAVPRPGFPSVRNAGPATVAGGDCAAPHRDA